MIGQQTVPKGLLGSSFSASSSATHTPRSCRLPTVPARPDTPFALYPRSSLHTCLFRSSDVSRLQCYSRLDQVSRIVLDCCRLIVIYIQVVPSPFPIYLSSPAVNATEMTTVSTSQDGQLTLRLASACVTQVIRTTLIQHLSWQLARPAPLLG